MADWIMTGSGVRVDAERLETVVLESVYELEEELDTLDQLADVESLSAKALRRLIKGSVARLRRLNHITMGAVDEDAETTEGLRLRIAN